MAVKLFVTDLDGTLLPKGTQVSEKNRKAVRDAVAAGVTVTIATGRMYRATRPVAEAIGVNVPIITYNGALIRTLNGETLYSNFLDTNLVGEVMDFFEARKWYLQSYSQDMLYYPEYNECASFYEEAQQLKGTAAGWDGMREHREETAKLLSITAGEAESRERMIEVREHFQGRMDVMSSNPRYIEMVSPGVSKASAIAQLAEKLGIRREEIMAIGDSNNDLPMLRSAGQSIAMGNAIPEVKETCDFVTGLCEEDGFAEAVYRYVLK